MTHSPDAADQPHRSPQELTFEQTVPRRLVHRAALSEVYIADSLVCAENEFALAVQIPRAHCVWFDRRVPYHDPLATGEAARQGVYVVVHRHLGVGLDMSFTLQRLELRVADLERYRDDASGPLQGVLMLRLVGQTGNVGALGTMTFEGDIFVADALAMTFTGELAFLVPADYAALRAYQRRRRAPAPASPAPVSRLDPASVGRLDRRNSVLGEPQAQPTSGEVTRYPVVTDQEHPSFFDHRYDHAPGPLLLEAYRQAAIVTAHRAGALPSPVVAISGCGASFTDFAELDAMTECSAAVARHLEHGGVRVDVGLHQFGKQISTGWVELQPYLDQAG